MTDITHTNDLYDRFTNVSTEELIDLSNQKTGTCILTFGIYLTIDVNELIKELKGAPATFTISTLNTMQGLLFINEINFIETITEMKKNLSYEG